MKKLAILIGLVVVALAWVGFKFIALPYGLEMACQAMAYGSLGIVALLIPFFLGRILDIPVKKKWAPLLALVMVLGIIAAGGFIYLSVKTSNQYTREELATIAATIIGGVALLMGLLYRVISRPNPGTP